MQIVMLAGNVGKDAKLNTLRDGEKVLNFSIAVDNGRDKDPTWWDCAVWGKRAEALERYVLKGTKLAISGRPSVRVHEDKAYLGCTVQELTFQSSSQRNDDDRGSSRGRDDDRDSRGSSRSSSRAPAFEPGGMDDDIPF
jgi:single-strand DNA-binding protein